VNAVNFQGETPPTRLKNIKDRITDLIHLGFRYGAAVALAQAQDHLGQDLLNLSPEAFFKEHQTKPEAFEEQALAVSLGIKVEDVIEDYSIAIDHSQEDLNKEILVFGGCL
jgi:hypothetical protein